MLKLLRKLALPNVVDFSLTDPHYNNIALLAGFDVKHRTFKAESKTLRVFKANNYIAKQFRRAERHAKEGNFGAFNSVCLTLLQQSTAFLVYSFNSVMPKWTSMDFHKAMKLLKSAQKLCKSLATDIDYKRVWIDKKPGDYARPLGVPKAVWRIYLRMVTNLGEIYAHGKDLYSPNQHGGRPGYGVMSCLRQVSEMLSSNKYAKVFEFDLKGFFDHISHSSMTSIFKGTFLEGLYGKMITSKPKAFKLPPITADKAVQVFNSHKLFEFFEISFREDGMVDITPREGNLYGKWVTTISFPPEVKPVIINREPFLNDQKSINLDDWRITYTPMRELGTRVRLIAYSNNFTVDFYYKEVMLDIQEVLLEKVYEMAMNKGYISSSEVNPFTLKKSEFTELDRAHGRDNWKHLDLPTQGVPQGTNFGPFLSSLAVSVYFKEQAIKDWIMYIDDGLLFHNTTEELTEKLARLTEALNKMSVELAPDKSRLHTYESLMSASIKFLGIRFKNTPGTMVSKTKGNVRNFFTITSDTRKGTKKMLPEINTDNMLKILENMLEQGLITISKYKYARWALLQSKMRNAFESDVVSLAIKYNFFGYILSWVYNPEEDFNSVKEKINIGIRAAEAAILNEGRSIGSYVLRQSSWSYMNHVGMVKNVVPDLNNHSTLCVDLLLETLQTGHVFLRDQGLASRAPIKGPKVGKTTAIYSNVITGEPVLYPVSYDKHWSKGSQRHKAWIESNLGIKLVRNN